MPNHDGGSFLVPFIRYFRIWFLVFTVLLVPHSSWSLPHGRTRTFLLRPGLQEHALQEPDATSHGYSAAAAAAAGRYLVFGGNELDVVDEPILSGASYFLANELIQTGTKKTIPNITQVKTDQTNLVNVALANQLAANYSFPLKDIVNATLNGGIYPTLVPAQVGPFPSPRIDVRCNPFIVPGGCTNVAAGLRLVGDRLADTWTDSYVSRSQQYAGTLLTDFEEFTTEGLTQNKIDLIEHDPFVQTLEAVVAAPSPLFRIEATDPLWLLVTNSSATAFWQYLERVDKSTRNKELDQFMTDKLRAARACRLFNGRLPNCTPVVPLDISIPNPVLPGTKNDLGFFDVIFVFGFALSCDVQGGCISGTANLQPESYDGFYVFSGISELNGQPIYAKRATFLSFTIIDSLFFFQERVLLSSVNTFPNAGVWAGITANEPNFLGVGRGARPPFAYIEGTTTPDTCKGSDAEQFPLCTSRLQRWRFGRVASASCSGVTFKSLCFYPVIPTILAE
eukprot:GHVU01059962.1.p1 GENE.GHVU01059962.1~~GHVU01059962.1.p1  ORF type:complete len:540 (+),score=52.69 GHVU01059962.1:98-1621(+)